MFDDKVWLVGKVSAGALAKRFKAVAQNIANVNTPGYKRKEVEFEETLREALRGTERVPLEVTQEGHIGGRKKLQELTADDFEEKTVSGEIYRLDGNNVDPEIEMAKMMETRMAYDGILRMMAKRMEMIKTAMGGK